MGRELTDLSFEEWLLFVFDHPATDPPWYHDVNSGYWNTRNKSGTVVDYMTRFFLNSGSLLTPYSDAQANNGLRYISSIGSDYFRHLHDITVPMQARINCIESIYALFEQVFAIRCSPHLSHILRLDEPYPEGYSIINLSCYMWWDRAATIYQGAIIKDYLEQYSRATLTVLEQILALNCIACQESALHGLGHYEHFSKYFREDITKYEVINIISKWLKTHKKIPNSLKSYALEARFGNIL